MKKFLLILSLSAFFFACKKETEAPKVTPPPTTTTNPNTAPNKCVKKTGTGGFFSEIKYQKKEKIKEKENIKAT